MLNVEQPSPNTPRSRRPPGTTKARIGGRAVCLFVGSLLPAALGAQSDPPPEAWDSVTDALRGHEWADGINNLIDIVEAMPSEAFTFTPLESMATFGEIVVHIADIQVGFCDAMSGRDKPHYSKPEGEGARATIVAYLMESIESCDVVFDEMTDQKLVENRAEVADRITTVMGHTRRETGKLVTYLRLAGIEPPEIEYYQGRKWRVGNPGGGGVLSLALETAGTRRQNS